jgi:hypothetical protein
MPVGVFLHVAIGERAERLGPAPFLPLMLRRITAGGNRAAHGGRLFARLA